MFVRCPMHTWHHDKKDTTVFGENKQIQKFKHKQEKKDKHKQTTTVFGENKHDKKYKHKQIQKQKKKDNETQRIKHIASNCSLGSRSKMNTEKCFSLSHHMFD